MKSFGHRKALCKNSKIKGDFSGRENGALDLILVFLSKDACV
jgi:hypothetical protein